MTPPLDDDIHKDIIRHYEITVTKSNTFYSSNSTTPSQTAKILLTTYSEEFSLTHWGRVTHICVRKLTIIGSDNGLSPRLHQVIIWTNAGILLIRTLQTNFNEILS